MYIRGKLHLRTFVHGILKLNTTRLQGVLKLVMDGVIYFEEAIGKHQVSSNIRCLIKYWSLVVMPATKYPLQITYITAEGE